MASRTDVEFTSEGVLCRAWLYRPAGDSPSPIIVMGHGLGATRVMGLEAHAERFVEAGYACLIFDYRHFGASDGQPRQLLSVPRQRQDWRAAIRFARTLEGVDPERVVAWGSSFGGGHSIVMGATEPGLAAVIAQCPFTDGLASALKVAPASMLRVAGRAIVDMLGSVVGAKPIYVRTVGPAGTPALMTAADAQTGYLRLVPPGEDVPTRVAARFGLQIVFHRPGIAIKDIPCPALLCVCKTDSVAPAKATLRHAGKAPNAIVKIYDRGHFDIYVDEGFEEVVLDQLEFLREHVPV